MHNTITYSPHYSVKINKIINALEIISGQRMARFLKSYINAVDTITLYALSSSNPSKETLRRLNYKLKFFDEYVLIYRVSSNNVIKMIYIFSQSENYQEYI